MKKKFFLAVLIVMISNTIVTAQKLDVSSKEGVPVILPTISNLTTLCELSENSFKSIMTNNKYIRDKDFETNPLAICYSNGIDGYMYNCSNNITYSTEYNYIYIVFSVNKNRVYPPNAVSDLFDKLKPYYVKTDSGYYIYSYNDYNIMVQYAKDLYLIFCWKKQ